MTAPPAGALEACLALLEKATPGPYEASDDSGTPCVSTAMPDKTGGKGFLVAEGWLMADCAATASALNLLKDHGPALLAALRLREWRPVLTMPGDGGTYLVTNQLGEVCPLLGGVIQNNVGRQDWTWGNPIIAWMPLPAPTTADDLARILENER